MIQYLFLVVVRLTLSANGNEIPYDIYLEQVVLTVPDIIKEYGYPAEIHNVTTSDGYILEMHRIPHGIRGKPIKRESVLLQHGLLCSSADFVVTGPENALGFILADAGYDVWIGNVRGNRYSRRHTVLDPDNDAEFWDFSFHEIGVFDTPAMIDYILNKTGQTQLFHIGHSQGGTAFYVMNSLKPEYNNKIKLHIGLAPAAYVHHARSPFIRTLLFWSNPVQNLFLLGENAFVPKQEFELGGHVFCGSGLRNPLWSSNFIFVFAGFNSEEINSTIVPIINSHAPAGSSIKQLAHYYQVLRSKKFRQYDYGILGNIRRYGRLSPPDYNLENIKAPVYIMYSLNDWLIDPEDAERLCKELPNCKAKFRNPDPCFNHLDYVWGMRASYLVYDKILKILTEN